MSNCAGALSPKPDVTDVAGGYFHQRDTLRVTPVHCKRIRTKAMVSGSVTLCFYQSVFVSANRSIILYVTWSHATSV